MSASALAATTQNERRGVSVFGDSEVLGRAAAVMELATRQDKAPDSPEVVKLKEERKAISPELDQAKQDMKAAQKAAEAAIPADLKAKEEAAFQKFKATRDGLTEDQKTKLKDNGKAMRAARKAQNPASSAPAAAPAATPAPAPAAPKF